MHRNLSATDAKARLADALRQAENGDVVLITRYGKPTAALLGAERLADLERRAATWRRSATAAPGSAPPSWRGFSAEGSETAAPLSPQGER